MRHPGSTRVEDLPNRSALWLLIVGWVALVVGVVLVISAMLPIPGNLTAEVSASARHLAAVSPPAPGGDQQDVNPVSTLGFSAAIADLSDNDGGIRTALPGTRGRGAFHAGDRSPIAVSGRLDLRLALMKTTAWGHRQDSVAGWTR
jgi:hypothetical protein